MTSIYREYLQFSEKLLRSKLHKSIKATKRNVYQTLTKKLQTFMQPIRKFPTFQTYMKFMNAKSCLAHATSNFACVEQCLE